jgi:hypothetical protein
MSSLSPKDRLSLCSFAFSDGRRCRTPRIRSHPHFCFYHAQKEARAFAADKLGKDLDYFFSGDYLSACDLSTALGRLIPAVVRGDLKPKTAHTVAYLAQTLMQAIHISQHEYCEAFGSDAWRRSVRNSVKGNYDYRFPPAPKPAPPAPSTLRMNPRSESPQPQPNQTPTSCHSERSRPTFSSAPAPANASACAVEEPASSSNSSLTTRHSPLPQAPQLAPSPHISLPATSAEFVQQVMASVPRSVRPGSTGETGGSQLPQPTPATPPAPTQTPLPIPTQANPTPTAAPAPSPTTAHSPQTPAAHTAPSSSVGHPERSDGSHPLPAIQSTRSAVPAPQPAPVAQPFRSLALPLPVRRRLHRA